MKKYEMDAGHKLTEVEEVEQVEDTWSLGIASGVWFFASTLSVVLWFLFIWLTVWCLKAWGFLT